MFIWISGSKQRKVNLFVKAGISELAKFQVLVDHSGDTSTGDAELNKEKEKKVKKKP